MFQLGQKKFETSYFCRVKKKKKKGNGADNELYDTLYYINAPPSHSSFFILLNLLLPTAFYNLYTMAEEIAKNARNAASTLKTRSNDERTAALKVIHDSLRDNRDKILEANKLDMKLAQESNLADAMIRRLDLGKGDKYDTMLQGILDVIALEDPVGKVSIARHLDDGLDLYRMSCPIGVLLVIFEARPEVIANISALAIKSGNAAILKGGKESFNTFNAMSEVIKTVLPKTKVPTEALQLVNSREQISDLLKQDEYIDLVIPRGSNQLVKSIQRSSSIPVMGHADGLCSVYIHEDADPQMAAKIVVDSKTNYPAACNSAETLLINENALDTCLSPIINALLESGVEVRCEESVLEELSKHPKISGVVPAKDEDFDTEFLSLTIAVKSIDSLQSAIKHINYHGSHHTDVIVTPNANAAQQFHRGLESACVFHNTSSRFSDGLRFGFGTEVGVSTSRVLARGPVGLEGITTYQYYIEGNGQLAGDYLGGGGSKRFKHDDFVVEN